MLKAGYRGLVGTLPAGSVCSGTASDKNKFLEGDSRPRRNPPLVSYKGFCSAGEWDTRQAVMARLRGNGYTITEAPNPLRLNALKEGEEFIIDIMAKDVVGVVSVKWVDGYPDEPVLVVDIPDSGRYGIRNTESKYYAEISKLCHLQ